MENRADYRDLTGLTFHKLTVLGRGSRLHRTLHWRCVCSCGSGRITQVPTSRLVKGDIKSCGCYRKDVSASRTKVTGTPEHNAWSAMHTRCYNTKVESYPRYGGRGIIVCESWKNNSKAFIADMGPRPSPKHSLDRIDVNGNYEPSNCRWADLFEQARNKTNNVVLNLDGKRYTVPEAAEAFGLLPATISARKRKGWSDRDCVGPLLRIRSRKKDYRNTRYDKPATQILSN